MEKYKPTKFEKVICEHFLGISCEGKSQKEIEELCFNFDMFMHLIEDVNLLKKEQKQKNVIENFEKILEIGKILTDSEFYLILNWLAELKIYRLKLKSLSYKEMCEMIQEEL